MGLRARRDPAVPVQQRRKQQLGLSPAQPREDSGGRTGMCFSIKNFFACAIV